MKPKIKKGWSGGRRVYVNEEVVFVGGLFGINISFDRRSFL
jgi:hypothetical protein